VVGDGLRQGGRQRDAKAGAEGLVVGQAAGEVALYDYGGAGRQVVPYLVGCCEQSGEVEAHPCVDIRPSVYFVPQRLVHGWHGCDKNGLACLGQQRRDGRLSGSP
jgi:hypothetical protein